MGLGSRRPDLPALRMPQGRMQTGSAGTGGLPTPSLSAPGFSLPTFSADQEPHTPLPHTPISFTEFYPMVMTPTPSTSSFDESVRGLASATSSSFGSDASSFGDSLSATSAFGSCSSASSSPADPDSRRTSLSSAASSTFLAAGKRDRADAEDDEEWSEREDGILESFLTKPLQPVSTPYPPATLPPPGALDEITSQVLHFHRPPSPEPSANATPTAEMPGGMASAPLLTFGAGPAAAPPPPTTRRHGHARNRSLSTQPWTHSWTATRRRLFQIARKEAIGGTREDRWKGRTEPAACAARGAAALACKKTMAVPSGLLTRRPGGGMAIQRLGSFAALDIDEEAEAVGHDAMEVDFGPPALAPPASGKGLGQVLRLSTSLQRSSRIPPQMMSNGSEVASVSDLAAKPVPAPTSGRRVSGQGVQRPPSLLQRGRSFTAEDFDTYLTLSMSPGSPEPVQLDDDSCMDEDDHLQMHGIRAAPAYMPSRHEILMASRRHERTSSDTSTIMADDRTLATPSPERALDGAAGPAITFTQTSPSPDSQMNALTRSAWSFGNDASLNEERSDPFMNKGAFAATPVIKQIKHRPAPLTRSFSSDNGVLQGPSALSEFMSNSLTKGTDQHAMPQPPLFGAPASAWGRSLVSPTETGFDNALNLPKPLVKKQRTNMSVDLPPRSILGVFGDSLDNGLRSPFDDGKTFRKQL